MKKSKRVSPEQRFIDEAPLADLIGIIDVNKSSAFRARLRREHWVVKKENGEYVVRPPRGTSPLFDQRTMRRRKMAAAFLGKVF